MIEPLEIRLGANPLAGGGCRFCVWAPYAERVEVHLLSPHDRIEPLTPGPKGYHEGVLEGVPPETRYRYRLNGDRERADPASRFQPEGVHGPSQVVDPAFDWSDGRWRGIPLAHYIIYELHPGTFTAPGTFDAAIERLKDLVDLGITAVELMPVAQFPGERNWGYDGVFPFAVQNSYGGPTGLKRFIDACHGRGLAVILDVVYNHLGPEGNYLGDFGPYFSDLYRTPWGAPLNFDGPDSDAVRRFFIENALAWIAECHVDALRLDAVHAILDFSAQPFLQDLAEAAALFADATGRRIHLIAESALNDTRLIRPPQLGGLGLDAQWNDDLHHSLHALLTGERRGYYCDFGGFDQLLKALREGFVYDGRYSAYRRRRHGSSSRSIPSHRLVVFAQNHDQVGNRLHGDRLSRILPFEALKLAAGIVLLAPQLPLIFMGEEYGETAPFPYFVSHSDPELIAAVRRGRREEFASFGWEGEPPDPQAEATFTSARLTPSQRLAPGPHRHLWEFHRRLIALRRSRRALQSPEPSSLEVLQAGGRVGLIRRRREEEICVVFHAGAEPVSARVPLPAGRWRKRLDSAEPQWGGPGSRLPDWIDSGGEAVMELPPYAFLVWDHAAAERG
jgi:maltooligosyltrehalose trehalohydrolase